MTDENDKFVEEMLKKINEKKETKAQSRTEGVDRDKVEEMTEELLGWKKKKEEGD
ncbi:hypothetical protein KY342_03080 [Candidatus Woesearchaeota archaeon]|nr:hypothetical protein [Candidatus Woesearchaeota archaeon]